MTIYVDDLQIRKGGRVWCHMATNGDLQELHRFAKSIGLKRAWFQDGRMPHYDLTSSKKALAIARGAEVVSAKELVALCFDST